MPKRLLNKAVFAFLGFIVLLGLTPLQATHGQSRRDQIRDAIRAAGLWHPETPRDPPGRNRPCSTPGASCGGDLVCVQYNFQYTRESGGSSFNVCENRYCAAFYIDLMISDSRQWDAQAIIASLQNTANNGYRVNVTAACSAVNLLDPNSPNYMGSRQ